MTEDTTTTEDATVHDKDDVEHDRDVGSLVVFGIAAASIAAVLQFVTLSSLDRALTVALFCFAVAIPVNIAIGLALHPSSGITPEAFSRSKVMAVYVVGLVVAFGGFTSLFWHFSWLFGLLFLVSTLVAVTVLTIVTS